MQLQSPAELAWVLEKSKYQSFLTSHFDINFFASIRIAFPVMRLTRLYLLRVNNDPGWFKNRLL
jgi:hypothetical protein